MAPQASMFPQQKLHCNKGTVFSMWSVPGCYKQDQPVPRQSLSALNANSSSLNMFTVVATIFQKIVTELNGTESEQNRIMAITKIVLKLMKQNGR
jgi:hypothetical protein